MINTVFLDMDGVFVNFRKGVHDVFSEPWSYTTQSIKWDFFEDWNRGITREQVNAICTTSFWQDLEWMHDGKDILMTIWEIFNPEDIYLLTTPMPNIESPSGKWMWVDAWLPEYVKRTIITQAPKHLLARPDTLLIDDKDENVDGFREADGKALLVPRPWNRLHRQADRTSQYVEEFLRRIT